MFKNENSIIEFWNLDIYDITKPMVSVCVATYNHELSISKTIESILSQETSFPFEIIIHDDCSTDKTARIVSEYECRYPRIIRAYYESYNLYSSDPIKLRRNLINWLNGKYIAICEGDDYWCDNNKLQTQYDYMESHVDCSLCCHNTIIHDLSNKNADRLFFKWNKTHTLSDADVFYDWKIHASSYFYRKKDYTIVDDFLKYWCGDYVRATYLFTKGKVVALPKKMSVYNWNNESGITQTNNHDIQMKKIREQERIDYLEKLNYLTSYKYNTIIQNKICRIKFVILTYEFDTNETLMSWHNYKIASKRIKSCPEYAEGFKSFSFFEKIKTILKYNSYFLFQINKKIFR